MKKILINLTMVILIVSMAACGKDNTNLSSEQTAEEALESLNEEIDAMIEEEQREAEREAEEREQKLEEGYPEGELPEGKYICQELRNESSDIYVDEDVISLLESNYFGYMYDMDTKTYTIFDSEFKEGAFAKYHHHLEGFLNDDGNLVITYYARYDQDILCDTMGAITDENEFNRFEDEYPEAVDLILDDIEWVYVFQAE